MPGLDKDKVEKVDANSFQESELIRQAREGDTGAFSALVETYQERAVHTACSLVGNLEDARDAAQDAFVKAYERLATFEETSRFYTWFCRILINTCKDFLRKKKFRNHLPLWFRNEEGDVAIRLDLPDKNKNPQEAMLSHEIGGSLKKAIEELPFQQRSVFALRYLEGLKLEEISEALDISVGTVKAHLWQATEKMKTQLKYLWEGE